jgi:transcriptional regulator with XRE-family HTH domain
MAASGARAGRKPAAARKNDHGEHVEVGERLRGQRERRGVGLRALAREIGISASAMSQIETGRSRPSVSTLYRITTALGMSLDELFSVEPASTEKGATRNARGSDHSRGASSGEGPRMRAGPVQRGDRRAVLELESGVRWERLTAERDPEVDFLHVTYDVDGASSRDQAFMRHAGREYGLVLSGQLRVTLGFEPHELGPGDSISFESSTPHLLENSGNEPVSAIWVCVGRHGDPRLGGRWTQTEEQLPH